MRMIEQLNQIRKEGKLIEELRYDCYILDKLEDGRTGPRKRLASEIRRYSDNRERMRKKIRQIERPQALKEDIQCIMLYRYVDGLNWEEIVRKLSISLTTAYKYNRLGIRELERLERNKKH